MAVPSFLSSEFGHSEIVSTTDVQDIMDELVTVLTGLTTPWTHSTGLFTSPVSAGGHQVAFQLTRISATVLDIDPVDRMGFEMFGVGITRRMNIVAAGDRVQLFYGPEYVWVETQKPDTSAAEGEHFAVGILDLTPEDQDAYLFPTFAKARRSSAGSLDAAGDQWSDYFRHQLSTGTYIAARSPVTMRTPDQVVQNRRMSGKLIHLPVDLSSLSSDSLYSVIGRQYQAFTVNGQLQPWTQVEIPIDDDPVTLGTFKVSNCREESTGQFTRIALRIA
jgi:hypothetical protein